jgi:co-chaperonin GroES (HSP10)
LVPAKQEDELSSKVLELVQTKKPYNQYGYVRYGSDRLEELGLKPGDKVFIQKNADYEMEINGEKLYRVLLSHIYAQVQE